jgi:hypothetical protein
VRIVIVETDTTAVFSIGTPISYYTLASVDSAIYKVFYFPKYPPG